MPGGEGICAVVGCAGEGYGVEVEKRLDVWDGGDEGQQEVGGQEERFGKGGGVGAEDWWVGGEKGEGRGGRETDGGGEDMSENEDMGADDDGPW